MNDFNFKQGQVYYSQEIGELEILVVAKDNYGNSHNIVIGEGSDGNMSDDELSLLLIDYDFKLVN
jgi:hypothetical protein